MLLKPCVNLSIYTASDARLPTYRKRQCEKSIGLANPGQPFSCSPVSPAQALELPSRPADQVGVDTQQRWSQLFSIELTVVVDPASDTRVVDRGQILQGLVTAMVKCPSPDRPADGLQCLRADGRPNWGPAATSCPRTGQSDLRFCQRLLLDDAGTQARDLRLCGMLARRQADLLALTWLRKVFTAVVAVPHTNRSMAWQRVGLGAADQHRDGFPTN